MGGGVQPGSASGRLNIWGIVTNEKPRPIYESMIAGRASGVSGEPQCIRTIEPFVPLVALATSAATLGAPVWSFESTSQPTISG